MKLLTAKELAERLGMNTAVVLRWHRAGRIPAKIHNGRIIRFVYDDVIEALHATLPPADPSFLVY
jgi:excisionase family DNA binding protein